MLVKIEHECDDGLMLQLTFEYTKGYQEMRYLSNGDPGYPGEPDGVDLVDVEVIGLYYKWQEWPKSWAEAMEAYYFDEVIEAATEREDY